MIRRSRSLREWAAAVGVAYSTARLWAADLFDPLPGLRIARRYHVDVEAAERWLARRAARAEVDVGALVDQVVDELRRAR